MRGGQVSGEGRGEMEGVLDWALWALPADEEAEARHECNVVLLIF